MGVATKDRMQELVEDILWGELPYEMKMSMLLTIEPIIEREFKLGNTSVIPVSKVTLQDIWPI